MSAPAAELEALYASFSDLNMEGGWHRKVPALWPEPRANFLPHVWHYADVRPILDRAGELVDTEFAERRNLTMFNPVEGNIYSTVRTIVAAYQMVKPGEVARAHRHTPNALRLILEGHGTYTVVDGKQVEMRPGDVLLTPNWAWHSHENLGAENCYWMDFLDVPLVHLLEPMFYQPHPQGVEPSPERIETAPIAFRAEDIDRGLAQAAPDPAQGGLRAITLGPAELASIALDVIRLDPGQQGGEIRETSNAIYAVMAGEGAIEIDGQNFAWSFGDTIAVPAWRPHSLAAGPKGAKLLKVSDRPLMQKLGWYRRGGAGEAA
ncbi:MAG TPA: cupin domain-containing protein [Devosia sp.]|nr:cupin domain-containing protein [Sphingomonadaceae bacterium]HTO28544.1 cupin domain-containing protein [Devosia sp.]